MPADQPRYARFHCTRSARVAFRPALAAFLLLLAPPPSRGQVSSPPDATGFSLSPDGKTLLVGWNRGKHLEVWNLEALQRDREFAIRTYDGHTTDPAPGIKPAFSPDGSYFVTLASTEKGPYLLTAYDVRTGEPLRTVGRPEREARHVVFAPHGKWLATWGEKCRVVQLWDAASGKLVRVVDLPKEGHTNGLAVAADGRLAVANDRIGLTLWDDGGRKRRWGIEGLSLGHGGEHFSPDSGRLLAYSGEGTVVLEVATGKILRTAEGAREGTFLPDGKQFLAAKGENRVALFDAETGRSVRLLEGEVPWWGSYQAVTPDGKRAVLADPERVRLFDLTTGEEIYTLFDRPRGGSHFMAVALSPDGRYALAGGHYKALMLWDVSTGKLVRKLPVEAEFVLSLAFAPDGLTALAGGIDGCVGLYEIPSGKRLRTFEPGDGQVGGVGFIPGRKGEGFSLGRDNIRIWDLRAGNELRKIEGAESAWAVDARGDRILTLKKHEATIRWTANGTKTPVEEWSVKEDCYDLAWSPDGRYVATAGKAVRLREWPGGKELKVLDDAKDDHTSAKLAFSPDGRFVASGDTRGRIRLWQVPSGRSVRTFIGKGAHMPVDAIAFTPDGKILLAGGQCGFLKCWDVETGKQLQNFQEEKP